MIRSHASLFLAAKRGYQKEVIFARGNVRFKRGGWSSRPTRCIWTSLELPRRQHTTRCNFWCTQAHVRRAVKGTESVGSGEFRDFEFTMEPGFCRGLFRDFLWVVIRSPFTRTPPSAPARRAYTDANVFRRRLPCSLWLLSLTLCLSNPSLPLSTSLASIQYICAVYLSPSYFCIHCVPIYMSV